MKLLASKFNEKKFFSDLSCTCVYGRYAPDTVYIVKCSIYSGGSKKSESGSTTTKPVPAPRRGRKPKEPRALDKL